MATFTWRRCPTRSADDTWSRRGNCAAFLNIDGCHKPFWGHVKFSEVVNQASALLHSKGRIAYRALKREFDLDDEALEDLKEELIEAERVAVDENGKILVWTGGAVKGETGKGGNGVTAKSDTTVANSRTPIPSPQHPTSNTQSP